MLGITSVYYTVKVNPLSNDECIWRPVKIGNDSTVFVFTQVKENGVTWNAGIRNGDLLLEINDIKVKESLQAQSIINRHKEGEYAKYKVKRGDRTFTTTVYIKKLLNFGNLGFGLLAVIWFAVSFVVIMAKPDGLTQKIFYAIGVAFILNQMYNFSFSALNEIDADLHGWNLLASIGGINIPYILLYFFWIFPKPFNFALKKGIKRLFIILPLLTVVMLIALRILFINNVISLNPLFNLVRFIRIIAFVSFYASLIFLIINYRRLKTKEERIKTVENNFAKAKDKTGEIKFIFLTFERIFTKTVNKTNSIVIGRTEFKFGIPKIK